MTIYSRPPIHNFGNWWFWIRKNKCIIELIKEQNHIVKIYLYAKYLSEPRYERLIKKREHARIKYLNKTSNGIYERSNTMDGVYENIDDL